MRTEFGIIRRPLVTEKATYLKDTHRQVVVEVERAANKSEIRAAAEKLLGVKIDQVKTMVCRGKMKRIRTDMGKQRNWKKAILTLKEGSDLDVFGVVGDISTTQAQ